MYEDSLAGDLHEHLHWWLGQLTRAELRGARWVMDYSWLNEVRRISTPHGSLWGALWQPGPGSSLPETLLGLPIEIREHDDGKPGWLWRIPHLEQSQ